MFRAGNKISHRFFSAFFLVAVIPIVIMGFAMYRAAEHTLIDSAYVHIRTIAQSHAGKLDTWYGERLNDIKVLSEMTSVQQLCSAACAAGPGMSGMSLPAVDSSLAENSLALTRGKSPAYQSIHVLDPSGDILASTDRQSEMIVSNKYREDLERLKESHGPVLSPLHQHSDGAWYIHLTVPVYSKDGKLIAAVFAILDAIGTIDPLLSDRVGLGSTGEAYLVTEEGQIVTQSRYLSAEQRSSSKFATFGITSALHKENGISMYRNYMGREVLGAYMWLPRYHSALLVEMQKDEVLAPLRAIRTAVYGTVGVVGLICILAAFFLSRQISRPIIDMADASRRIANGSLNHRISYARSDEIGTLSRSFNSMADELAVLIDSLKQKEISLKQAYDELVRTQKQLVQSEKMAAIGELAASVVHEIRNPLSSVKLNFQIIGRSIDRTARLYEHYSIGLAQISQLEKMLSGLLDYSKPVELERVPLDIETIVNESIEQLKPRVGRCAVELEIEDSLPQITGDPGKMRQVLVNIIHNAIEASGEAGTVRVRASAPEPGSDGAVLIEVSDNGPGITAQDLKRIFQPFFTTKEHGTGLGLSIVKKIMEAHMFGMSVSSEKGFGTVVSLHLQRK